MSVSRLVPKELPHLDALPFDLSGVKDPEVLRAVEMTAMFAQSLLEREWMETYPPTECMQDRLIHRHRVARGLLEAARRRR